MSRPIAHLAVAAFAALAVACATDPLHVRVDQDPAHSVADYRTFGFYDQSSTDSARYQTLLTSHLQASIRRQLESRGYVYSQEQPQLLVNFAVNVHRQHQIQATPAGGLGLRSPYLGIGGYNVDTVTTKQGTVTIDVVDATNRSIIWQGVGEGALSAETGSNTASVVNNAVTRIFRDFPSHNAL
jgi:hypothetical protein